MGENQHTEWYGKPTAFNQVLHEVQIDQPKQSRRRQQQSPEEPEHQTGLQQQLRILMQ